VKSSWPDIDERQPRQVKSSETVLALPAWSDDCAWLLASDGRGRLFKLPAAGGPAQPFTDRESYYAQAVGERVIFNDKQRNGVRLWSKPMAGGAEMLLKGLPLISYADAWAVTSAGVYYTARDQGRPALHFYDFASRAIRRIAQLPKPPAPGGGLAIAVSQDGHWVLYTQDGEADSDIMLADSR
jgi:hypothetical protein